MSLTDTSKQQSTQQSFGLTQSSSNQHNQAYPYLQKLLGGTVETGQAAGNSLADMLGLNGPSSQNQGFSNWQNSTGYQFGKNQGMQSIIGDAATHGLLNSGSTLKALNSFGQNYANTQYGNFTSMLQNLLGAGLQGASTIGSAGNVSNSQSTGISSSYGQSTGSSTQGVAPFFGQLMAK